MMHTRRVLVIAVSIMLTLTAAATSQARGGPIEDLVIDEPHDHWRKGRFVNLVPSIHVPLVHGARDVAHVWLRLPEGARIDVRKPAGGAGPVIVLPAGARVDRVEYRITDSRLHWGERQYTAGRTEDPPEQLEVVDVRGVAGQSAEAQQFRILRRRSGKPWSPLIGWAWSRGDETAREEVNRRLEDHLASARRPVGRPPLEPEAIEEMINRTDCAGCHLIETAGKPADIEQMRSRVRDTDAWGLYTVMAVLNDHVVVSNHRLEDVNHDDPFVEVRCGDRPVRVEMTTPDKVPRFTCPGGSAPIAHRDVESGLAKDHDYTMRLCEARRFFFERSTPAARKAFQESYAVCGIGEGRER